MDGPPMPGAGWASACTSGARSAIPGAELGDMEKPPPPGLSLLMLIPHLETAICTVWTCVSLCSPKKPH